VAVDSLKLRGRVYLGKDPALRTSKLGFRTYIWLQFILVNGSPQLVEKFYYQMGQRRLSAFGNSQLGEWLSQKITEEIQKRSSPIVSFSHPHPFKGHALKENPVKLFLRVPVSRKIRLAMLGVLALLTLVH